MIEPIVEPQVEGKPEAPAWFYTISKYAGDIFFPPEIETPAEPGIITAPGGSPITGINKQQFFNEVRAYFRGVPWTPRASRAGFGGSRSSPQPTYPTTPTGQNIAVTPPESPYMERVEQLLIAKFKPEARTGTTYQQKREAERREGQKKEFTPRVLSKDDFLKDLSDRIESVNWRPANPKHTAKISRPGVSRQFQRELEDES